MSPPIGIRTPPSTIGPTAVPVAVYGGLRHEDAEVRRVDELADFAVPEVERADADADVRLELALLAERQEAHDARDRA